MADSGEILFDDELVNISGPNIAKDLGIGMVHQHYKLVENLLLFKILSFWESHKSHRSHDSLRKQVLSICDDLGFNMQLIFPLVKCRLPSSKELKYLKHYWVRVIILMSQHPSDRCGGNEFF